MAFYDLLKFVNFTNFNVHNIEFSIYRWGHIVSPLQGAIPSLGLIYVDVCVGRSTLPCMLSACVSWQAVTCRADQQWLDVPYIGIMHSRVQTGSGALYRYKEGLIGGGSGRKQFTLARQGTAR